MTPLQLAFKYTITQRGWYYRINNSKTKRLPNTEQEKKNSRSWGNDIRRRFLAGRKIREATMKRIVADYGAFTVVAEHYEPKQNQDAE